MKSSPVIRFIVGSYLISIITFENIIRSALKLSIRADQATQAQSGENSNASHPLSGGDEFFTANFLANVAKFVPSDNNGANSTNKAFAKSLSLLNQVSRGCRDATRAPLEERKAEKIAEVLAQWNKLRPQQKRFQALAEAEEEFNVVVNPYLDDILDVVNPRVRKVQEDAQKLGITLEDPSA